MKQGRKFREEIKRHTFLKAFLYKESSTNYKLTIIKLVDLVLPVIWV